MLCTEQVYQIAAIISVKSLLEVSGEQGQSYLQSEYDPRRELTREDIATISCIVDRLHLFRWITDMSRGRIL